MIPQKVKDLARFIVERAKEPSTWGGISSIALLAHIHLNIDQVTAITAIGVGIASCLAIVLKE